METQYFDTDDLGPPVENETQQDGPNPRELWQPPDASIAAGDGNALPRNSASQDNESGDGRNRNHPTRRVACTECQRRKQKVPNPVVLTFEFCLT